MSAKSPVTVKSDVDTEVYEAIDRLITVDVRARGRMGALYAAAREASASPLVRKATALLNTGALKPGKTVLLVTGYPIPHPLKPTFEVHSDGPIGIASLARTMKEGFGVAPKVVTDEGLGKIAREIVAQVGLRPDSDVLEFSKTGDPVEISRQVLDANRPSAIVVSEKLGMNVKGVVHAIRGDDMSKHLAKVDPMFVEAAERGIPTVGIGDVGNEVGMGVIEGPLEQILVNGGKCRCGCGGRIISHTRTDSLIIGAMSDWGAYGLAAGLAYSVKNPELVPDGHEFERCMDAMARATGLHGPEELLSDDISIECTIAFLTMLKHIVASGVQLQRA